MSGKTLFRFPDKLSDVGFDGGFKLKLAVLGASRFAGASFVSSFLLQKGPFAGGAPEGLRTLVEVGTPYFYAALGMEKRFAGRQFFDYTDPMPYKLNMELGYNWFLKIPGTSEKSELALFKAVAGAPGNYIVYDFSGITDLDLLSAALSEMDQIYLVLDPLPSKLIDSQRFSDEIRGRFPDAKLVVNKFNKGIHRGELSAFLGTSNYFTLDAMPYEKICRAEYNCNLIKY